MRLLTVNALRSCGRNPLEEDFYARKNSRNPRRRPHVDRPGGDRVRWRRNRRPRAPSEGGQTGGEITVAGCTPENPLVPGNTAEVCGGDIVDAMTSKLVEYNTENAAPENDIAESIETTDNKLFTVKLKPYKFHDGTEVKAKNFVDAWNYTAYGPNGQEGSYFMGPIAGYADVQCPDADCKQHAQGQDHVRAEGRRRQDLHHPDQRAGVQPAGAAGLLGLLTAAGLLLRRPEGLREEAGRRRTVQGRLDQQHRDRALQVRRVLRREQGQRRQADLPDLPGSRRRPTPTPWPAAWTTSTTATSRRTSSSARRTRTTSRIGPRRRSRWSTVGSRSRPTIRSWRARRTSRSARPSRGPSTGI